VTGFYNKLINNIKILKYAYYVVILQKYSLFMFKKKKIINHKKKYTYVVAFLGTTFKNVYINQ